jgi:hypothetical protein
LIASVCTDTADEVGVAFGVAIAGAAKPSMHAAANAIAVVLMIFSLFAVSFPLENA